MDFRYYKSPAILCLSVLACAHSQGATVVINTLRASMAAPNVSSLVGVSTGSVRASMAAPAVNSLVVGNFSTEGSGPVLAREAGEPAAAPRRSSQSSGRSPSQTRTPRNASSEIAVLDGAGGAGGAGGSKDALPTITYEDPGALRFNAEAGYASKHLWRGVDLAQLTSLNYAASNPNLEEQSSGVSFIGASTVYKGFLFSLKYIETIDDRFNPFFSEDDGVLDSYQEMVISTNYTRILMGPDWIQGTAGFDFYFYPNGEFWGVDHQGMLYTRFSCPHYKWAQPFVEFFYNVATESDGNGLANDSLPGQIRNATGSDLVEGAGAEFGVNGGDTLYSQNSMSVALTYSVSAFYKRGYQFEDDGISHVTLTVGAPISIGSNLTLTPSVSYVEALGDISSNISNGVELGADPAAVWNEPGWVAALKVGWQF